MKVIIDIDKNCIDNQVIIKCSEINENIIDLQRLINSHSDPNITLELSKGDKDFYITVDKILFFETDGDEIKAHTEDEMFTSKYRLYELEQILPWCFNRISKSAIVNIKKIYSITRNLTSSSAIEFRNTPKKVYVSRGYYKPLKSKINEMRNFN